MKAASLSSGLGRPSGARTSVGLRFAHRGAALMEVLLALALFVAAAAVVTGALNSSLTSLERQKLGLHALNLATSTLAEIQLGLRPASGEGQQAFASPLQEWTWELLVTPLETEVGEAAGLVRAEVVIRHATAPVVQRLAHVLKLGTKAAAPAVVPEP